MADASKTLRNMMLAQVQGAKVTRCDPDAFGALCLDFLVFEAAGFLPNEKVEIYNITTGSRLSAHLVPGAAASGELICQGELFHLLSQGDNVTIVSYGLMKEKQALKHVPRVVVVDGQNAIVSMTPISENEMQVELDVEGSPTPMPLVKQHKVPKALRPAKKRSER